MSTDHPLVVFDGECRLCSGAVRFILERDRAGVFRFVPLQSSLGRRLLRARGHDPGDAGTMLLVDGDDVLERSDAVLAVARRLPGWGWTRVLRAVPRAIRDAVYSLVARNRFRWFGRRETCYVPTAEERSRFLDDDD